MKGVNIFLSVLLLWSVFVWADQETFNARLSTLDTKRCYTLKQGAGLTSVEFARLRAICWKTQLGDGWAAKNPVYKSTTLSQLPKYKTPEEQAADALAAEEVRKTAEALATRKKGCEDMGAGVAIWNNESGSCRCVTEGNIISDNQCLSPAQIRMAKIEALCSATSPRPLMVADPDDATKVESCYPIVTTDNESEPLTCSDCHNRQLPRRELFDDLGWGRNLSLAPIHFEAPNIYDSPRCIGYTCIMPIESFNLDPALGEFTGTGISR